MDSATLKEILRLHGLWLANEAGGVRANLTGADLTGADLTEADLRSADLTGANLTGADLTGANLRRANLTGAKGLPESPVVPDLHRKVAEAVGDGCNLHMKAWHHKCGTKHCRAGWAIVLAGKAGAELEAGLGPNAAGALIYHASTGMVPDFYASDADALADIRKCAGL